ncbi:hypothetical protein ACFRCI_23450 [Streptomyces sp. NPDC056638]|uniref:hypothetical protein n=1 Tax=Streptomyces sp. NPDC056638 TaxID=3345887 RepID=UPI00367B7379
MTGLRKTPAQRAEDARQAAASAALAAFVVALLTIPLQALVLMAFMGTLHGITAAVPAVGYWLALVLVVGLDFVAGFVRRLFRK